MTNAWKTRRIKKPRWWFNSSFF